MLIDCAVPIVPYVDYWEHLFKLGPDFTTLMDAHAESCGYTDYIDKYLTFPPRGPFPTPKNDSFECNIWGSVAAAGLDINPCFNVLHILDTCPHLWNVLGIVNSNDYS